MSSKPLNQDWEFTHPEHPCRRKTRSQVFGKVDETSLCQETTNKILCCGEQSSLLSRQVEQSSPDGSFARRTVCRRTSTLHRSFLTRAFSRATHQQRSNIAATRDGDARERILPAACRKRGERVEEPQGGQGKKGNALLFHLRRSFVQSFSISPAENT